jgi:hypothetical protein
VLGDITRNGDLSIYDSASGLTIQGTLAGTTANQVLIRTVGNLTLSAGAQITTTGVGNLITLQAAGASFINLAGAGVLQTDARYRVYSAAPDSGYNAGGLTALGYVDVNYPNDPVTTTSVFYFSVASASGYASPFAPPPALITSPTPVDITPTISPDINSNASTTLLNAFDIAQWNAQKQITPMTPYLWNSDLSRMRGYVLLDEEQNPRRKRGLQYLFEPTLMAQPNPEPSAVPSRQAQSTPRGTPLAQVSWR